MGEPSRKNWEKIFYLAVFIILVFTLINDLNLTNLIKENNLEEYSINLLEKNSKNKTLNPKLIFVKDLSYSKLLVFETRDDYHSFYFSKGRLVKLYNYQMEYINKKTNAESIISYDLSDSVYEYSFDLKFSGGTVAYIPKSQVYSFDFSAIILLIIFLLVYLFLDFKKNESLKIKKIAKLK